MKPKKVTANDVTRDLKGPLRSKGVAGDIMGDQMRIKGIEET